MRKSHALTIVAFGVLALVAMAASAVDGVYVENNNLGRGIANPTEPLMVVDTDDASAPEVITRLRNNGAAYLAFDDTVRGETWGLHPLGDGSFSITKYGSGGAEVQVTGLGTMILRGGLITGTAGSCTFATPCDGLFAPDFAIESIDEHAEFMWENSYLEGVGPTAAGEPINLTHKTTGLINELEKAHVYIEQLHKRLAEVEAKLEALDQK